MSQNYLPARHPTFTYHSFFLQWVKQNLHLNFNFSLENGPHFTHQVIFPHLNRAHFDQQPPELINNLTFHLGLIELFSYWKLAASPLIKITCGHLTSKQTQFWHHLLINGMSEYFYRHQLDFTSPNFVTIKSSGPQFTPLSATKFHSSRSLALNLGGGKDSAVMQAILEKNQTKFVNLIVQPASPAALQMAKLNARPTHLITRQFDPQLFTLNQQGYLNGHVPFSATLAFINLLAGVFYDFDYAIVGNEKSSNECTLTWRHQPINHQYSKSYDFEHRFQHYSKKYLLNNVKYFSLIRPFSELKIAQIFSTLPQFFSIFKSCNQNQQQNTWCHHCPKCLFVFTILYPFLDEQIITTKIFHHNLFYDSQLLPTFRQLLGLEKNKPFECVGEITETQTAFYLISEKITKLHQSPPPLIAACQKQVLALHQNYPDLAHQFLHHHPLSSLPTWTQKLLLNGIITT
jgi:hypothetical protein